MILGVGIDLVEIARVERAARRHGARFLERIFTEGELAFCLGRKRSAQHLAARFAAKEAAAKALGTGVARGVRLREIEVTRSHTGQPQLRFSGEAARAAAELGVAATHVSLTHSREHAAAVVTLEGASPPPVRRSARIPRPAKRSRRR